MIRLRLITAIVFAALLLSSTSSAGAEEIQLPLVGNQFPVVGLDLRAGPLLHGDSIDADTVYPIGPGLRLGLQHIVTRSLSMNAEVRLGATAVGERQLTEEGTEESTVSFDWSFTALARYQGIGSSSGWTFAGGAHYRSLRLPEASMLQFGLDGRFGRHIWVGDETFLIIEAGVHFPLIDGLSQNAITAGDDAQVMLDDWFYPTASLGIQLAF